MIGFVKQIKTKPAMEEGTGMGDSRDSKCEREKTL